MLISIQYPLADARTFIADGGGRLPLPRWTAPDSEVEFVRGFGRIAVRPRGGASIGGEQHYCDAHWAVRFQPPGPGPCRHCAFRRFYTDGNVLAKFEIGMVRGASSDPVAATTEVNAVHEQLATVHRRLDASGPAASPPRPLAELAPMLADAYLHASTAHGFAGVPPTWWVRAGAPVVLVMYSAEDRLLLPAELRVIDVSRDGRSVALSHWWQPFRGKLRRVWFLGHEPSDYLLARQLRIDLARLHCEYESLRIILRHVACGKLLPEPRSALSDRLQHYLNDAITAITELRTARRSVICETSCRLVEAAAAEVLKEDTASLAADIELQLSKLDARPNIRRKVRRYAAAEDRPGFYGGHALIVASDPGNPEVRASTFEAAAALRRLLLSPACGYQTAHVRELVGERATVDAALVELDRLAETITGGDTVLIYFAGAGGRGTDLDGRETSWIRAPISVDLLAAKLREIPAARVVVILDCHDPGSAKDQKSRTPTMAAAAAFQELAELVAAPGRAVIASFQSTSSSSMSPAADEFAQRLLAGLAGKAMRADGTVGVLDLFGCISTRSSFSETSLRIFKAGDMESNFVVAAGRPSEPSASLAIPAFVDRARLCRMILDAFTPLEFEALCVAIAELLHRDGRTDPFSHSIIEGNAIEDRVGNLIDYLEQRQLVEYLVRAIAGEQRDQITAREPALAVVRVPESSASRSVILFLAANPSGTTRLRLDEECAGIELELSMSAAREDFDLRSKWAVTVDDMMRHLAALQPVIIHFSGHGHDGPGSDVNGQRLEPSSQRDVEAAPEAGIYLQGEHRQPMLVSARALAQMFASAASSTRIVVLNACFSDALAESLCSVVDCVVGMRGAVDDDTARSFAASFYRALGNRSSVANAVDQAIATLAAKQLPGEHLPVCRTRPGVQAERVFVSSLEARRSWLRLSQRYP